MDADLEPQYRTLDLPFGTFQKYKRFVIGKWVASEATPQQVNDLRLLLDVEFEGMPYGYIGDRVNPHSVDTVGVSNVLKMAVNLKYIAFVTYNLQAEMIASFETQFYQSHQVSIFHDLKKAMNWMNEKMSPFDL